MSEEQGSRPPVLSKTRSGAGGNWKTIDERADSSVPAQSNPLACVAATGEMLLRSRGINVSQEHILAKIQTPATVDELVKVMNEFDRTPGKLWRGGAISDEHLELLGKIGDVHAVVFHEGGTLGHMVLVESVTDGEVFIIKDPFPINETAKYGTIYTMTREEFMKVWGGEAIFK
ncbi:MAG: cysteine peptidase family C39 domain-containing protein [Pyrinomonadaceae bacterium MAG19_C2-C3]|nr:cysteine peptidase family C39 domain-containing protein [Pyrinomonadaceae bacterium MAG19_C2-C3]